MLRRSGTREKRKDVRISEKGNESEGTYGGSSSSKDLLQERRCRYFGSAAMLEPVFKMSPFGFSFDLGVFGDDVFVFVGGDDGADVGWAVDRDSCE